ncbi:MAG: GAF domain-containing protein [Clostridia bacterium]|nr:GAF domain-containing protein [Clostridia bacterium]
MSETYLKDIKKLPTLTASLIEGETDLVACLANVSALIFDVVDDLNWAGFYLLKDGELVLGPFQGKPACVRLKVGKGVCGTAVAEDKPIVVPNVHEFDGHIACDSASMSEIVVPLHDAQGKVIGVLDVDSPKANRFFEIASVIVETALAVEKELQKNI